MCNPRKIELCCERLQETTSTNDYLKQRCKEDKAKEFYTVIAECQTNGKGQRGNCWESEEGKNLTFSTVIYPTALEAKKHFIISAIASYAVYEALAQYTSGFSIKWPNDLYWHDKKIGGILIENDMEGKYITQSIIGIGINVNQLNFLSDAPNPVSLAQITGAKIERKELFAKIIQGLISGYLQLEHDITQTEHIIQILYQKVLYRRNGMHPYRDAKGCFSAQIHKVEPNGYLVLKDEQNMLRKYAFKEVEFIIP